MVARAIAPTTLVEMRYLRNAFIRLKPWTVEERVHNVPSSTLSVLSCVTYVTLESRVDKAAP